MQNKPVNEMSVEELKSEIQGCSYGVLECGEQKDEKLDTLVSELADRYYRSGEINTITAFVKELSSWIVRKYSQRKLHPMTARDVLFLLQREVVDKLSDAVAVIVRQEENKDKPKEQAIIIPASTEKSQ